jgi:hypothetical protein
MQRSRTRGQADRARDPWNAKQSAAIDFAWLLITVDDVLPQLRQPLPFALSHLILIISILWVTPAATVQLLVIASPSHPRREI